MNSERQWHISVSSVNYEIYFTICNTIQLPIISSNDPSKANLDESILENTDKIHQTFTHCAIPDQMFTTTIFELESLRIIRPVTNISDDVNDFKYEINHNSTPP